MKDAQNAQQQGVSGTVFKGRRIYGQITLVTSMHLFFFSLIAIYLFTFHRQGENAIWLIYTCGVVAELLPLRTRYFHVAELLLVASLGVSYFILIPHSDPQAFYGVIAIALTYICLIPSMLGRLRYLLGCVILEIIWQGQLLSDNYACLVVLPIGLGAIAVDAWLVGISPAQAFARFRQHAGHSLLRWALVPLLVTCTVGLVAGTRAVTYFSQQFAARASSNLHRSRPAPGPAVIQLDQEMHIGDQTAIPRDGRIAARLSWEDGPDPQGMVYLRGRALSEVKQEGSVLRWTNGEEKIVHPAPPPLRTPNRWAWVLSLVDTSDVVLHPDGGDAIDLDKLYSDREGNRYFTNLHALQAPYRADFDDGQLIAPEQGRERYTFVPSWLDGLPWQEIEQPHWKEVSAQRASVLICETLRKRCSYAEDDLPTSAPGPGGALRTFLFGSPQERRGHCQYFAMAATLLLRRSGHCARCVTGYASDEVQDHIVIFHDYDAHAWCEVIDDSGHWLRVDATPSAAMEKRAKGPDAATSDPVPADTQPPPDTRSLGQVPTSSDPAHGDGKSPRFTVLLIITGAVVLVLMIALWLYLRHRTPVQTRLALLQRQSDELFRLAEQVGIAMRPGTTLTMVIAALQQRAGMDLGRQLDQHLRARYDSGPIPPPWPLVELHSACQQRIPSKDITSEGKRQEAAP